MKSAIITNILLLSSVAFAVEISIYQHPTDKTKSIVECSYDNGRKDDRLIVSNEDLENENVITWVEKVCLRQ